ncbi:hemerythrin domain-containing protein [Streptomyces seoulensis]
MNPEPSQSVAILETRLLHKMHRAATSLLADAAPREQAPLAALEELRGFLVPALRHHHESEDDVLWPLLIAAAPPVAEELAPLNEQHKALDDALDALAAAPLRDGSDRLALAAAAALVRDLVHEHLEHEEPVLFAALAEHMSDEAWAEFSRSVIATSPTTGIHLNFGFFARVGTREELAAVTGNLPEAALEGVAAMQEQAGRTLDPLQAAVQGPVATA